ncbi:MAG: hypothetical protein AMK75_05635, partial [Planctomycetes bacterium SM23_65]
MSSNASCTGREIAVIGMAGRFPGANSIEAFWENLRNGVESITQFSDSEVRCSILNPGESEDPDYVRAGGVLDGVELFDASFFGLSAREAEVTDPQHRLFLECAWEALESAGHDPGQHDGPVGVFAGAALGSYLLDNLLLNPAILRSQDIYQLVIASDKDYLATRVSYVLNLGGPSLSVQTACSTSMVGIHLACQSLVGGECDLALAGGVSIRIPQREGHLYKPGGLVSPDGHTRAFDAKAAGTLFSSGVGVVVLRRLTDALADGDHIHAVIKGTALNNDGSAKTGFTAPSMTGQTRVIAEALAAAHVHPKTITYVEAHGTATVTGDPIEIAALTEVFRSHTQKKGYCAIGTVKTNVGHLNAAAGVAGVIKTALALEHKQLPASLHFEQPNPEIDFANSPFYVNRELADWHHPADAPRRAAVSSLGIGGTNAYAILEEAPPPAPSGASRPWQLLTLSARTATALEAASERLASHLEERPDDALADVCYTLKVGRRAFRHRRMATCRSRDEAIAALRSQTPERVFTALAAGERPPVVFMFPGQGSGHVNMTLELYREEPDFRETVDACAAVLKPDLGVDLRDVIYPAAGKEQWAARELARPTLAHPALFTVSYALAKLWIRWGIQPDAVIGHSTGEVTAACVADVLSWEDALRIVSARGRRAEERVPPGAMLVVVLPEEELMTHLGPGLSLATVTGPSECVVSGLPERVRELEGELKKRRVPCKILPIARAYHSEMLEPILPEMAEVAAKAELNPPDIPLVSCLTGTWATEELTLPAYWVRQFREPVRFFEAMESLRKDVEGVLVEMGPGQALSDLVRRSWPKAACPAVVATCRHERRPQSDVEVLLSALGRLWLAGVPVDWHAFYAHERRRRLRLPTYPFERQRYWVEPQTHPDSRPFGHVPSGKRSDIADWFYVPSWKRLPLGPGRPGEEASEGSSWLLFIDACGLGVELADRLEQTGHEVTRVIAEDRFARVGRHVYTINPRRPEDYAALFRELAAAESMPTTIVHLWSAAPPARSRSDVERFQTAEERGYYSLLSIAQALAQENVTDPLRIHVVSSGVQAVTGEERLCPEHATLLGLCTVIPQEYPNITCHSIDVEIADAGTPRAHRLTRQLLAEVTADAGDRVLAYRAGHRWVQGFEPIRLEKDLGKGLLRPGGVYLITGGLGRIGLVLAEYLSQAWGARLVLTGRSGLPKRDEWPEWLSSHDPDDRVSRRIRRVQELERLGAEVMVLAANVADERQMREVLDRACERFGAVHGVFHAAGVVEDSAFADIPETGRRESETQFEP